MIEQSSSSQAVKVRKMPLILLGWVVGFIARLLPQYPFLEGKISANNLVGSFGWGLFVAIGLGFLFSVWDTFIAGNDSINDLDAGDVIVPFVPGLMLGSIVAMFLNP